jgi:PKD repeat protein
MTYDSLKHHRGSIRLRGYNYSQAGIYYVTLTIQDRERILGSVVDTNTIKRIGRNSPGRVAANADSPARGHTGRVRDHA